MSEDIEKRNADLLALDADQRTLFLMSQADSCIQKLQENREMNEALRLEMQQNTKITQQVMDSTKGLVEAFNETKKGAQILSSIGRWSLRMIMYWGKVALLVASLVALLKGHPPGNGE